MNAPQIILSENDFERISQLIYKNSSTTAALLEEELSRANIVPDTRLPKNVVAMNSRVTYVDSVSGEQNTITLVYPNDADLQQQKISVLAAVGAALIGLEEGARIEWPLPGGTKKEFKVLQVSQAQAQTRV